MSTPPTQHTAVPYSTPLQPAVEHLIPYTPGESLQAFNQRTGIPIEKVIKLNANESPYGPVPAALQALRDHDWYNQYPDTQAHLLKEALSRYTGLDVEHNLLASQPYLEPIPSEGNFILAKLIDERISLPQLQQAMEADGILLRYFPRLARYDYVRITVGLPEHTYRIRTVLEQLRLQGMEHIRPTVLAT